LAVFASELDIASFGQRRGETSRSGQRKGEGTRLGRVSEFDVLLEAVCQAGIADRHVPLGAFIGRRLAFEIDGFGVGVQELAADPLVAEGDTSRVGIELLREADFKVVPAVGQGRPISVFAQGAADRQPFPGVVVVDGLGVDASFPFAVGEAEGFRVGRTVGHNLSAGFGFRRCRKRWIEFAAVVLLCERYSRTNGEQQQDSSNYPDEPDPFHENVLPLCWLIPAEPARARRASVPQALAVPLPGKCLGLAPVINEAEMKFGAVYDFDNP
jgi:hypothetical protein